MTGGKEKADAVLGTAPAVDGIQKQYTKTTYGAPEAAALSNDDSFDPARDAVLSLYERLCESDETLPQLNERRLRGVARRMLGQYGLTRAQLKAARDAFRLPVFLVGKGVAHVD